MELKVKHIFITAFFCLFSMICYAQTQHPPEPRMQDLGNPDPCGQEDGGGTTPPVGLCLPVDDYIYPFLVMAIIFGAYKAHKFQTAPN